MIVAGVMLGMVAGTPIINTPDNARVGADVHPGPPQWLSDFQRGTTLEEIVPAALAGFSALMEMNALLASRVERLERQQTRHRETAPQANLAHTIPVRKAASRGARCARSLRPLAAPARCAR